jgi:hypothetical protein
VLQHLHSQVLKNQRATNVMYRIAVVLQRTAAPCPMPESAEQKGHTCRNGSSLTTGRTRVRFGTHQRLPVRGLVRETAGERARQT